MTFNELNSVEHYNISQLSGVNLNHINWAEEKVPYGFQWSFLSHEKLNRGINEVIVDEKERIPNFLLNLLPLRLKYFVTCTNQINTNEKVFTPFC